MEIIRVIASEHSAARQPQPFPLQGSKRGQVPVINQLIPSGQPRLIEPFCGSAAMAIGARNAGLVGAVELSDLNVDIANLWAEIISAPGRLSDDYAAVWSEQFDAEGVCSDSRAYFNQVRDHFNAAAVGEGAPADFLFLLNRIVKAALRYSSKGMNQSADGRRVGAKPSTVEQRLMDSARLMEGARVHHRDWLEALTSAVPDDLIYLDPPYQGTSGAGDTRYRAGLSVGDFEAGVRGAVARDLSLIISYDAIAGPAIYGRPLDESLGLVALDVVTGVSAQGTLLGRKQAAHETLYLSPALIDRLGGVGAVRERVAAREVSVL